MNIFQKYEKEFKELVDAAYKASRKRPHKTDNSYVKALLEMIQKVKNTRRTNIDKRDIEQQLALLWLEYFHKYHEKKHKTKLRNYLLRMSVWGLRDWLKIEMQSPRSVRLKDIPADPRLKRHILDLRWLLYGDETEDGPLFMLSSYERYLLYLRHVCGNSIDELAELVHKNRKTVIESLVKIISKIRSYSNAEANTGRSCEGRDGLQAGSDKGTDRFSGD